jgi:3-hydroxyacyl-CoA dehydrogenase/enoyl-CoA hydratase/3-hydroxybutyryl-CoA epimerase
MKQTREALGEDYVASPSDAVISKFVEELDRKGKRFGKGFYDYPDGAKKHLWLGLKELYPLADEQPTADEVKKRLLYAQAIETVRCMDEGVVTHAADADIGSIFGWGFPPYTGGTISYIETEGLKAFVAEADRLAQAYGDRFAVPDSLRSMSESGESFYQLADAKEHRTAA